MDMVSKKNLEKISIIIPIYNEEGSIEKLYNKIKKEMTVVPNDYEIIYIDDGSTDNSFTILEKLNSIDSKVKIIKFRQNFGQTPAFSAGIEYSSGEIIITMDGDLQNDPADISRMLGKLNEGYDVVSGWREKRQDDLITRKIPSKIANSLLSWATGTKLHDYGCSLKVYRASVLKPLHLYSEMHRFIPAFSAFIGGKVTEMKVNHLPRIYGTSKYGISRIWKVLIDLLKIQLLVKFSRHSLVWFFSVGSVFLLLGLIFGISTIFGEQGISENEFYIVYLGSSILYLELFAFFASLGILGELITRFQDKE